MSKNSVISQSALPQSPRSREKLLKETVLRQSREIEDLKKKLKKIIGKANKLLEDDNRSLENCGEETEETIESSEESSAATAFWDAADETYRCDNCGWEVISGVCQSCCNVYEYDSDDENDHEPYSSISTDDCNLVSERLRAPRGETPLLEIKEINIPASFQAEGRGDEFRMLLARGATAAMCERYKLRYTPSGGIIATADEALRDIYAGAAIEPEHEWRIHLGRCLTLEDGDTDGAQFLENLLEEVLYFPMRPEHSQCIWDRWETVRWDDNVWVTRPIFDRFEKDDSSSDEDGWDSDDDRTALERARHLADRALGDEEEEEVIQPDEYESTGSEGSEGSDSDMEMQEPDWAWQAGVSDVVYNSDTDMVDELDDDEDSEGDAVVVKAELVTHTETEAKLEESSSSADSDFDSSEELSGDEEVMYRASVKK
ncbi:hypothetical protein NEOLEDRAFT_1239266, partial [Neolentinus lepideus HHB14362 ss-1]